MDPKHCIPWAVYYNISSNGINFNKIPPIRAVNTWNWSGRSSIRAVNTWNWSGRSSEYLELVWKI